MTSSDLYQDERHRQTRQTKMKEKLYQNTADSGVYQEDTHHQTCIKMWETGVQQSRPIIRKRKRKLNQNTADSGEYQKDTHHQTCIKMWETEVQQSRPIIKKVKTTASSLRPHHVRIKKRNITSYNMLITKITSNWELRKETSHHTICLSQK
jgi:hypothetical protein